MNILVVSESVWNRGVVYDIHLLSENLIKLDNKVYALDPGEIIGDGNEVASISRVASSNEFVEVISPRLLPRKFGIFRRISKAKNMFDNRVIRRAYIEYAIQKSKCDVILLYSGVRLGPEVVRVAKLKDIPIVFRNVDKLYNLWHTLPQQLVAMYREHKTYKFVNTSLALTPSYRDYLIELGADPENTGILPFPLDCQLFQPNEISKGEKELLILHGLPKDFIDSNLILFMGTFYQFTGLVELVKEASIASAKGLDFKLLLVGDGPIRADLDNLIKSLNLQNVIHITGYQPFDHMPTYIRLAKVCINAFPNNTRTRDIFSAKIIQYLACAKPVVSTRIPGIERALPEHFTGIQFVENIQEVLAKAIELLNDVGFSNDLGKLGRHYVVANNSIDKVAGELLIHLKNVVQNAK